MVFNGAERVSVDASTKSVAIGAINSGVNQLILNISSNPDAMENTEFIVPESISYFELRGNAANYRNLKIKSEAATTVLNGLNITTTSGTPLDISSENVTFNRVNISSTGFVAILRNANANVGLYGSISMNSSNGKAIVCRNTTLSEVDPTISSSLSVVGNIYICGNIAGQNLLTITNGNIINISDEEFEKYAKGCYQVTFDANGGLADTEVKTVYYGTEYGELPVPTMDYYSFDGWYKESGEVVTASTVFDGNTDINLYAHWNKNNPSDWVPAIEVPNDAEIVNEKWTYKQKETTTSSSNSKDGWIRYDKQRTSWGATQGPVYSDPSNGVRNVWSESYVTSSNYKTIYHYYRFANSYTGGNGSYTNYYPNYYQYDFDYPLEETSPIDGHARYMYWYSRSNWTGVYACDPYTTQEWVSDNYGTRWYYQDPVYTYYYYRYVDKESSTEINPSSTISGIVHWVKYVPKNANEFAPQEFDALILHKESQKPIESHDGNIIIGTENLSVGKYQTWHFTRNSDGTYTIASHADGKVIDLEGLSTTSGANIMVHPANGGTNQQWYIQECDGGYNIVPKCSPVGVMDLTGGKTDDYTNVQFYHYNGSLAQIFSIRILPDLQQYLSGNK